MAEWKMKDFDLIGQVGKELLLVEVAPKLKYAKNEVTGKNERTDRTEGFTYEVLMKDKKYKSMRVTVLSEAPLINQQELDKRGEVFVKFEALACHTYISNGYVALSFKASSINFLKK